jgi:hypothetical protein
MKRSIAADQPDPQFGVLLRSTMADLLGERPAHERISRQRRIFLRNDSVEAPSVGDALQLVFAGVFERQPAAGDEILHRLRDANL